MITEKSSMIMIDGMGRSGTTFMAQCLNMHPAVFFVPGIGKLPGAHVVEIELFKSFLRYLNWKVDSRKIDPDSPIENTLFSQNWYVNKYIRETDLNHKIPDFFRKELLDQIRKRNMQHIPNFIQELNEIVGDTYAEVLIFLLNKQYAHYGKGNESVFGFKTGWCEQMMMPLAKTFPNMHFIHMLRDPRGSIASNYATKNTRYPLILNLRDWRKSVFYRWKYAEHTIIENYAYFKYEDLVDNYEDEVHRAADVLNVGFRREMLNAQFKKPNSSYSNVKNEGKLHVGQKTRWQTSLPPEIVKQIEYYCCFEMDKMEYQKLYTPSLNDIEDLRIFRSIPFETLSPWCQVLVQNKNNYEDIWEPINRLLEEIRFRIGCSNYPVSQDKVVEEFFFEEAYYNWLTSESPER